MCHTRLRMYRRTLHHSLGAPDPLRKDTHLHSVAPDLNFFSSWAYMLGLFGLLVGYLGTCTAFAVVHSLVLFARMPICMPEVFL